MQQAVQANSQDQNMLLVLSRLINQCADNVESRLSDVLIARRSQGSKQLSIIALTQGGRTKSKKQKKTDSDASASASAAPPPMSASAAPPPMMYALKNKSPIQQSSIAARSKRPAPRGNGDHLPISQKTFSTVCNRHVTSKKGQSYMCSGAAACDSDARPRRFS